MPDDHPAVGDIYLADKSVFPLGDAHNEPRRIGVVAVDIRLGIVHAIARTTQRPRQNDFVLESPIDESCGLTKDGWWNARFQQPVLLRHFGTSVCVYMGTLPPPGPTEINQFYTTTKMLGL